MGAVVAADVRGAIDGAFAVEYQPAVGIAAVRASSEAVQYLLCPLATLSLWRAQLVYRSAVLVEGIAGRAFPAAKVSRSIQVARAVEDQITPRDISLLGSRKAVQDGVSPLAAVGLRRR